MHVLFLIGAVLRFLFICFFLCAFRFIYLCCRLGAYFFFEKKKLLLRDKLHECILWLYVNLCQIHLTELDIARNWCNKWWNVINCVDYLFNRFLTASRTVLYLISQFLSIFSICLCSARSDCFLYLYSGIQFGSNQTNDVHLAFNAECGIGIKNFFERKKKHSKWGICVILVMEGDLITNIWGHNNECASFFRHRILFSETFD